MQPLADILKLAGKQVLPPRRGGPVPVRARARRW